MVCFPSAIVCLPPAKGKKTIAVFDFASDFASDDIPAKYRQMIRNEIEFFLFNTKKFKVLEREKIDLISKEHYIKHVSRKRLAISVGKTLAVDFAVTGDIDTGNSNNANEKKDIFKLRIKIINIKEGTILGAYSKKFEKITEINKLTQKISKDIVADISYYNQYGKIKDKQKLLTKLITNEPLKRKYDNLIFNINSGFIYFYPLGVFSKTVKYGYGLSMDVGLTHLVFDNMDIGIETGYYRLKSNVGDFDRFILVPVLMKLEYKFSFYNRYFVFPNISTGINIISNEIDAGQSARIEKGIVATVVEPMLKGGLDFGIRIGKDTVITIGANFGAIFEKDVNMYFLNYSLSAGFRF